MVRRASWMIAVATALALAGVALGACAGTASPTPAPTTPLSPGGFIIASDDPPMAIALPAGWTRDAPKPGEVFRASGPDATIVAEVVPGTDRAAALAALFGAGFQADPKVRVLELPLPLGTPLRAATASMSAYAYAVGDHVVRLTITATTLGADTTGWDALAVGFNPSGTTFP